MEDETPASLGVQTPATFILASACTNWHDWHSSTPATVRPVHLRCCEEDGWNQPSILSPAPRRGRFCCSAVPDAGLGQGLWDRGCGFTLLLCVHRPSPPTQARTDAWHRNEAVFLSGPVMFSINIAICKMCCGPCGCVSTSLKLLQRRQSWSARLRQPQAPHPGQITTAFHGPSLLEAAHKMPPSTPGSAPPGSPTFQTPAMS